MLLIAFGSLVLVPLLTGFDPNVTLFTAGLGTLIFQWITRGRIPVFLASSFAFIAPMIHGTAAWGISGTLCGLLAAGSVYLVLSGVVYWKGSQTLVRILPPIVTGPIIMVIGLSLAPVAVNLALGNSGDGNGRLVAESSAIAISMVSLFVTVGVSLLGKGMFKLLPVLMGTLSGFAVSIFLGVVDFGLLSEASWFQWPAFTAPTWNFEAIIYILPVAIAPAIEHFGDVLAIGSVTGKDYIKNPGLHRTLLGDGLATMLAACFGGPPNTTYSEVTGGVALTRAFNPAIMTWSAIFAIVLAFVGKMGALLRIIPTPVIGGILVLLFGAITVVGMSQLVKSQEDVLEPRSLAIVGIILIFGVGGMSLSAGKFTLAGVGLASVFGVFLNAILPHPTSHSSHRK